MNQGLSSYLISEFRIILLEKLFKHSLIVKVDFLHFLESALNKNLSLVFRYIALLLCVLLVPKLTNYVIDGVKLRLPQLSFDFIDVLLQISDLKRTYFETFTMNIWSSNLKLCLWSRFLAQNISLLRCLFLSPWRSESCIFVAIVKVCRLMVRSRRISLIKLSNLFHANRTWFLNSR